MKNLWKTASIQNFHRLAGHGAGFVFKFSESGSDLVESENKKPQKKINEYSSLQESNESKEKFYLKTGE